MRKPPTLTSTLLLLLIPLITNLVPSSTTNASLHTRQTCQDVPNWTDSDASGCSDFYSSPMDDDYYLDEDPCEIYGTCCDNLGHTAQTACCACGGGTNFLETCSDYENWSSIDGTGCGYFDDFLDDDYYYDDYDTACFLWGEDEENVSVDGIGPLEACCICGGGVTSAPGPVTSASPTKSPLSAKPVTSAPTMTPVTSAPTSSPSMGPPATPTKSPSTGPTPTPTNKASVSPSISMEPTGVPSTPPTDLPSVLPSDLPTVSPTSSPSMGPTEEPSVKPSVSPSISSAPTDLPTVLPSNLPSVLPSDIPSDLPSVLPSKIPSDGPSVTLSVTPSMSTSPTATPSTTPSTAPLDYPVTSPSVSPSVTPTDMPLMEHSSLPTTAPSGVPSVMLGNHPTPEPSKGPSVMSATAGPSVMAVTTIPTVMTVTNGPSAMPVTSGPTVMSVTMAPVTMDPTTSPVTTTTDPTVMPVTMAPVTEEPTLSPVAATTAPVTSPSVALTPPITTTTQFNMAFDRMNCNTPIDLPQKLVLANLTAIFISDDDAASLFSIESLDVVEVQDCDVTMARQLEGYGTMEFTMELQALILSSDAGNEDAGTANDGTTTSSRVLSLFDVKEHIVAKFNDTVAVDMLLNEIRGNEAMSTFEMVFSLAVEVLEDVSVSSSVAPSVSPVIVTAAPVPAETTTVTDAPVVVVSSTKSPVANPAGTNDVKSAAAVMRIHQGVLSRSVAMSAVVCVFAVMAL